MAIPLSDILNSKINKPQEQMSTRELSDALSKGTMKVHIEISSSGASGDTLDVTADIDNQADLDAFHAKYERFMPEKGNFLQKILRRK